MHRRLTLGICVALTGVLGAAVPGWSATDVSLESSVLCTIEDPRLVEISGITFSIRHANVVWVHNDSSDAARIYGLDLDSCAVVAEVDLRGVSARDIEGIAAARDPRGRPVLWIGDIGDNRDTWPDVGVYRIREPAELGSTSRKAREYRFTYDDRPHNAETVMVAEDRIWIATWQLASGGLYELPGLTGKRDRDSVLLGNRVGDVGSLITDGAIAPDASGYVLRDYLDVHFFQGPPPGRKIATLPMPAQPQGEAVTWTPDGSALLTASEGDNRILRVEIPWWVRAGMRPPDHLVTSVS
jgi:hypothetical protein